MRHVPRLRVSLAALTLVAMGPVGATITTSGCVSAATSPAPTGERSATRVSWSRRIETRCQQVAPTLHAAAERHGLDPALIMGIARVESAYNPSAVSRVGALGLLQVMPSNGERLECGDLTEPAANAACGLEVLRRFLKHYDGDIVLALSAYNGGYRAANVGRRTGTPSNMSYVRKVLAARAHYRQRGCRP